MKRYLLDTNILVAHLRQPGYLEHLFVQIPASLSESLLLVSVVSVAEMRSIARRNRWGEPRLAAMEMFFQQLSVISISSENRILLDTYVDIDVNSIAKGRKMSKNDLWIAATAAVANATLLTADRDFEHLEGQIQVIKVDI